MNNQVSDTGSSEHLVLSTFLSHCSAFLEGYN